LIFALSSFSLAGSPVTPVASMACLIIVTMSYVMGTKPTKNLPLWDCAYSFRYFAWTGVSAYVGDAEL
jgi:hypothetical protein